MNHKVVKLTDAAKIKYLKEVLSSTEYRSLLDDSILYKKGEEIELIPRYFEALDRVKKFIEMDEYVDCSEIFNSGKRR